MTNYLQQSAAPTRKTKAAGAGGALATVVMGAVAALDPDLYARIPPGVEAGIATLAAFAFAYYFKREPVRR